MPIARRRNAAISQGCPISRNKDSPPGSSLRSVARPWLGSSLNGRAAQAGSSSSRNAQACCSRARVSGEGCADEGMAARSGKGSPSRTPLDRTNSPSSQRVSCACSDEVVTARASLTPSSADQLRPEVVGGAHSTELDRNRNRDQISLVLRGISGKAANAPDRASRVELHAGTDLQYPDQPAARHHMSTAKLALTS